MKTLFSRSDNGGAVTYEVAERISKGTGGKVKTTAIYKVGRPN